MKPKATKTGSYAYTIEWVNGKTTTVEQLPSEERKKRLRRMEEKIFGFTPFLPGCRGECSYCGILPGEISPIGKHAQHRMSCPERLPR